MGVAAITGAAVRRRGEVRLPELAAAGEEGTVVQGAADGRLLLEAGQLVPLVEIHPDPAHHHRRAAGQPVRGRSTRRSARSRQCPAADCRSRPPARTDCVRSPAAPRHRTGSRTPAETTAVGRTARRPGSAGGSRGRRSVPSDAAIATTRSPPDQAWSSWSWRIGGIGVSHDGRLSRSASAAKAPGPSPTVMVRPTPRCARSGAVSPGAGRPLMSASTSPLQAAAAAPSHPRSGRRSGRKQGPRSPRPGRGDPGLVLSVRRVVEHGMPAAGEPARSTSRVVAEPAAAPPAAAPTSPRNSPARRHPHMPPVDDVLMVGDVVAW